MTPAQILKKHFGYDSFRPGQESLVKAILQQKDVLGILPTGSGKSLCYQVPALLLDGMTIVISPLISLMQDQVASLRENGIAAAFLNSSLSSAQIRSLYWEIAHQYCKILYVAPERLSSDSFLSVIRQQKIALLAVDEAHCISQWGQDFRPSYLEIPTFVAGLSHRPIVAAYTATATEEVRNDIRTLLQLQSPKEVVTGFDRPNLFFDVQRPAHKLSALLQLLETRREKNGIIYCSTRSTVNTVSDSLVANGYAAAPYHAGLEDSVRQQNQLGFQHDRYRIIVATNAFGMGIDKSNVSFVIHYNMPMSIEAYYQEAGRAGRDGSPAECILLYGTKDIMTAKFLIENRSQKEAISPEVEKRQKALDYQRLNQMIQYCQTADCLRSKILHYFGQSSPGTCQNCGNCIGDSELIDITIPAQMILSCVYRIRRQLGYSVGATLIAQVLSGSKNRRLQELQLEQLSTYGLMQKESIVTICHQIEWLELHGYLKTEPIHQTLELTEASSMILRQKQSLSMRIRKTKPTAPQTQSAKEPLREVNPALFAALKEKRTRLAQRKGVPAYVIFSNATLTDMAQKHPMTLEEFLSVSGVGHTKAEQYGEDFLAVLRNFPRESEEKQKGALCHF